MTAVDDDADKANLKAHVFKMSGKEYRYVCISFVILLKKQSIKSIFIVFLYQASVDVQMGAADGAESAGKGEDRGSVPGAPGQFTVGSDGGPIQGICRGIEYHPSAVSCVVVLC